MTRHRKSLQFLAIILLCALSIGALVYDPMVAYAVLMTVTLVLLTYVTILSKDMTTLAAVALPEDNRSAGSLTIARKAITQFKHTADTLRTIITEIDRIGADDISQLPGTSLGGDAGRAIGSLMSKLKAMKEDEARQTWAVKGLASLSEIRKNESSLTDYADQVISTLVKFVGANQGVFYFLDEDRPEELQHLATYAYGKKSHNQLKQIIPVGDGLVGQCVLEKELIYLRQVPQNFIKITSGLGEALPRSVIIAPLLYRQQVFGVIELASFTVFEDHHRSMISKAAENIAAELSYIIRKEHTTHLLEYSRKNEQELKEREEALRQNMEEMKATQEEMEKVRGEMNAQLRVLDKVMTISKADRHGNITYVNEKFLENTLYSREELIGKNHRLLKSGLIGDATYTEMWRTISSGKTWSGELANRAKDGTVRWVEITIAPLFNSRGEIVEYLSARFPIDERKRREEEMKQKELQLQTQLRQVNEERKKNEAILEGCVDGVISFNSDGLIQYFNHTSEEIFGIKRTSILGTNIREILDLTVVGHNGSRKIISSMGHDVTIRTEVNARDKDGNDLSLLLTSTVVHLENGELFTLFIQKISVDLF
jgi:PAS domain S-box-containing protein